MDILTIDGGVKLKGEITISGSKNAALPILIATLLSDEACRIENVPYLDDIETMIGLLVFLGKKIVREGNAVVITAGPTLYAEAPYELVRRMRASVVVMGPLLARLGQVKVSLPGGCAIGGRPINIHLDGFRSLGAEIVLEQGYVEMHAEHLRGAAIHFDFPSVGATENIMMAAALSEGTTVLNNVAMEPEIVDLANFLNTMGARIQGAGTETISIEGVAKLHGADHTVIPDRIEAGTYLIAGAMGQGELILHKMQPDHLVALMAKLRQAGVEIEVESTSVRVKAPKNILPVDMETAVHPGFPTDLQAQWIALMTLADGVSQVTERVFENRFMHVPELVRMGADIQIKGGNTAIIKGVSSLSGADIMVSDLRAGAALVLAGLAAQGKTTIHRVYHLDRGYEHIEDKLTKVGAHIKRSSE
ncbi:MAG: UDP-N-acetylglucosamine 1-carboxyvinyltransferase [Elusimicrobiota bacterium]|jgi:UDP-N-acetylglucosamine 1-carboxyvinyltransferase